MLIVDNKFDLTGFIPPEAGFALLVNKPADWTSFDVVAKLRNAFKIKKVGHAGTLDPFATGLLILCFGKATKQIDNFQAQIKTYRATVEFGRETDSYDITGKVIAEYSKIPAEPQILTALDSFLGLQLQTPPMFSALKVNGKKLYELARAGQEIERKSREITVYSILDIKIYLPNVKFTVVCSKGTYIRSIAFDLGKKTGSGAYLKELSRTAIGEFQLENALTVDEIIDKLQKNQGINSLNFAVKKT